MSGGRPPVRYVPPKPRRWHEDLSWWSVLSPTHLVAQLVGTPFVLLLNRLPNDWMRLGASALVGFLIGFVGGIAFENWRAGVSAGGVLGTLGAGTFGVMWLCRVHREAGGGRASRMLLGFALCVLAAMAVAAVLSFGGG